MPCVPIEEGSSEVSKFVGIQVESHMTLLQCALPQQVVASLVRAVRLRLQYDGRRI